MLGGSSGRGIWLHKSSDLKTVREKDMHERRQRYITFESLCSPRAVSSDCPDLVHPANQQLRLTPLDVPAVHHVLLRHQHTTDTTGAQRDSDGILSTTIDFAKKEKAALSEWSLKEHHSWAFVFHCFYPRQEDPPFLQSGHGAESRYAAPKHFPTAHMGRLCTYENLNPEVTFSHVFRMALKCLLMTPFVRNMELERRCKVITCAKFKMTLNVNKLEGAEKHPAVDIRKSHVAGTHQIRKTAIGAVKAEPKVRGTVVAPGAKSKAAGPRGTVTGKAAGLRRSLSKDSKGITDSGSGAADMRKSMMRKSTAQV